MNLGRAYVLAGDTEDGVKKLDEAKTFFELTFGPGSSYVEACDTLITEVFAYLKDL
jgi:hypothetical protein